MADRVVVLRSSDGLQYLADSCAAIAEAVNEIRLVRPGHQDLIEVYAEMVHGYARLVRRALVSEPQATVRLAIIDHLIERLRQAQAGEITVPLVDVIDRLHAEVSRETVPA